MAGVEHYLWLNSPVTDFGEIGTPVTMPLHLVQEMSFRRNAHAPCD